ncbi:2-methylisocitrate lyase-like PEP mutase family enzyme [Constrictibacter sp. MBR-5]|jgi:methylisocitrate lyase|uniref:isocitrate lyase/PEP mutase family protein n=1 Tax=Constrictibacter sp. MBR-5 TaxID=3156467 RepID=UPI0033947CD6
MNAQQHRRTLRAALDTGDTLVAPGAYDAVSAKLIERAGFPVAYIGSYATAASELGLPDVGILTRDDLVRRAATVAAAVGVPVIADAENGFANAANIWRTVEAFERAGVAGIHIEDQEFGKHADVPQVLAPLDTMLQKIRAAVDARQDPNFLIIARTDAVLAQKDVGEAVRRMQAFVEAGADMVFPAGMLPSDLKAVRSQIPGRVVVTDKRGFSVADEKAAGANLVLYYGFTLFAAYQAVEAALAAFRQTADADEGPRVRDQAPAFEKFIGYDAFVARARKYGLA